ncbi:MAG: AAA family ATPase [Chlamydiales bacterium]
MREAAEFNGLIVESCYDRIREWYNGYQFSKSDQLVYNHSSALMLLDSKDFTSHWYETGTASIPD